MDENRSFHLAKLIMTGVAVIVFIFMAFLGGFRPPTAAGDDTSYQVRGGYFGGIRGSEIILVNRDNYSKTVYRLSQNPEIRDRENVRLSVDSLLIHSEIRLVLVNGTVRKIILVEVSS